MTVTSSAPVIRSVGSFGQLAKRHQRMQAVKGAGLRRSSNSSTDSNEGIVARPSTPPSSGRAFKSVAAANQSAKAKAINQTKKGFEAWASGRGNVGTSTAPAPVFMPTVEAPKWDVVTSTTPAKRLSESPSATPATGSPVLRSLRRPPGFEATAFRLIDTAMDGCCTPTPVSSPVSPRGGDVISTVPAPTLHDEFVIESERAVMVVPTMCVVTPSIAPIAPSEEQAPAPAPMVAAATNAAVVMAAASFIGKAPSIRALVRLMVAIAALICVVVAVAGEAGAQSIGAAAMIGFMALFAYASGAVQLPISDRSISAPNGETDSKMAPASSDSTSKDAPITPATTSKPASNGGSKKGSMKRSSNRRPKSNQ